MPKILFAALAMDLAVDIDYANFKDEVKHRQGPKRASVYMGVWSALYDLQPFRRKASSAWSDYFDQRYFPDFGDPPLDDPEAGPTRDDLDEAFRQEIFGDPIEEAVAAQKRGSRRSGRPARRVARRTARRARKVGA